MSLQTDPEQKKPGTAAIEYFVKRNHWILFGLVRPSWLQESICMLSPLKSPRMPCTGRDQSSSLFLRCQKWLVAPVATDSQGYPIVFGVG